MCRLADRLEQLRRMWYIGMSPILSTEVQKLTSTSAAPALALPANARAVRAAELVGTMWPAASTGTVTAVKLRPPALHARQRLPAMRRAT
jgi:hypothetical protein